MFTNKKLTLLAVVLVFLNIAVFTYFILQKNQPDTAHAKIIPNIKPLVLLSETNAMVKEKPEDIQATSQTAPIKNPTIPTPAIQADINNNEDQEEVKAALKQINDNINNKNQQQVALQSNTVKQPIAEAVTEPTIEASQTSKLETETLPEPEPITPPKAIPPPTKAPIDNLLCYTIGPFEKKADKIHTQNQLNALSIKSKERIILEKEISSYYLYIPPHKTSKAAKLTLEKLKKKKVRDFYLVRDGKRTNSIALGLFSQEKHALRKFDLLKKLYFKVKMEVRYIDKEVYWLDYQGKESVLNNIDLQQLSPLPLQLYLRQCKN